VKSKAEAHHGRVIPTRKTPEYVAKASGAKLLLLPAAWMPMKSEGLLRLVRL